MEIDNTRQILDYDNAVVCPLYDPDDNLCGCIHLVNKIDFSTLAQKDCQDISLLSPSISEMINMLDITHYVTEVST